MKKIISRCPVCNRELTVARLKCDSCDTVIENNFSLSKFEMCIRDRRHTIKHGMPLCVGWRLL